MAVSRKGPRKGIFHPRFPEKYVGDASQIIYRSNLERRFMEEFDKNSNFLNWGSEEMHLKYLSPVDNKVHRYFPDFIVKVRTSSGDTKLYMIEIKPESQLSPPKKTKNQQRYISEMLTWKVNEAKWIAAKQFCSTRNMTFITMSEKQLKHIW